MVESVLGSAKITYTAFELIISITITEVKYFDSKTGDDKILVAGIRVGSRSFCCLKIN